MSLLSPAQVRTIYAYRYTLDTKLRKTRSLRFERYDCSDGCPVETALEQIAGKWKGLIIYHLLGGTMRFSELSAKVGTVTQRSLTKQLRELEAEGIIHREVYPVVPPKVEYSLTAKGLDLHTVIKALGDWGQQYPR